MPLMNANMYMMLSEKRALIIDPNRDSEAVAVLTGAGVNDITVILTHEHFDHISGVNVLRELMDAAGGKCTVYSNSFCADATKEPDSNLSRFFEALFISRGDDERILAQEIFDSDYACETDISFDNDLEITWEDIRIGMHLTPGHSPGSICIEMYDKEENLLALATGDSLVEGNTVITRLPNGSKQDYKNITRPYLEGFPEDTLVLPGHGEITKMRDLVLG